MTPLASQSRGVRAVTPLPPKPYALLESSTTTANGLFHLYLVDANGRKIAALWGAAEEKLALGRMIVLASGGDPDAPPVFKAMENRKRGPSDRRMADFMIRSAGRAEKFRKDKT